MNSESKANCFSHNVLDQHLIACHIHPSQWRIWYSLLPVIAEPDLSTYQKQTQRCLVVGCTQERQSVQAGINLFKLIYRMLSLLHQPSQQQPRVQLTWHTRVPLHEPQPPPYSIHFCATQEISSLIPWLSTRITTLSFTFILLQCNKDNRWFIPATIPSTSYHLFLPSAHCAASDQPTVFPSMIPYELHDKTLEQFVAQYICIKGG